LNTPRNYIQRLQGERNALAREVATLRDGLDALRAYFTLPKFSCGDRLDGYVNVADVLLRLREAENAASDARDNGAAESEVRQ
jgi:hypothetical protein